MHAWVRLRRFDYDFERGPMESLFSEILSACDAGLHFIALSAALSIPDICGALGASDGWAQRSLYRDWYSRHMSPRTRAVLSAEDCYSLRCGVSHQGRIGRPSMAATKVIFAIPTRGGSLHGNSLDGLVTLDAREFCNELIEGARGWWLVVKGDPIVRANLPQLFSYKMTAGGALPPGFKVIA